MTGSRRITLPGLFAALLVASGSLVAPTATSAVGLNCSDPFVCYTLSITSTGDGDGTLMTDDGHISCVVTNGQPAATGCSWRYRTLLTSPTIDVDIHSQEEVGSRVCFVSKSDAATYRSIPIPAYGDCSPYRTDPAAPSDRLVPLFITLSGNATVEYELDAQHLGFAIVRSGTGHGTVTSKPAGISCGSLCSTVFAYGTSVTLIANATTGSVFVGWTGFCAGSTPSCTTVVTDFTSVGVSFALAVASPAPSVLRTGAPARPTAAPSAGETATTASPGATSLPTAMQSGESPPVASAGPIVAATAAEPSSPEQPASAAVTVPIDMGPIGLGIAVAGLLIAAAIVAVAAATRRRGGTGGGQP
jgi:hypothetical protein